MYWDVSRVRKKKTEARFALLLKESLDVFKVRLPAFYHTNVFNPRGSRYFIPIIIIKTHSHTIDQRNESKNNRTSEERKKIRIENHTNIVAARRPLCNRVTKN